MSTYVADAVFHRAQDALGLTLSGTRLCGACPRCNGGTEDERPLMAWSKRGDAWTAECQLCGGSHYDALEARGLLDLVSTVVAVPRGFDEVLDELDAGLPYRNDHEVLLRPLFAVLAAEPDPHRSEHVAVLAEKCAVPKARVKGWLAAWKRAQKPEPKPREAPKTEPQRKDGDNWLERDSDVELARALIADLKGGEADLVYDAGDFWRYDPTRGCWTEIAQHRVWSVVAGYDGRVACVGYDARGGARLQSLALRSGRISGCIRVAEALCSDPGFCAAAPVGIAFRNADITATSTAVVVSEPRWELRRQHSLQYDYDDGATCPRWIMFLDEVLAKDPERVHTIAMLQEFIGAALVGLATKHAKSLVLAGGGANGKSVLLDVVTALFPEHLRCALTPQDSDNPFRLSCLAGKRLNVVNELPAADIVSSEKWKAILSGNLITAERKHKDPFSFRPVAAHVYAANSLPSSRDYSEGFWRRQLVVVMDRYFDERERDTDLADGMIATELPGIARWALEGAVRLRKSERFTISETTVAAIEEWREDSDPCRAWVHDRLVIGAPEKTQALTLYDDYREWVAKRGHMPLSMTSWGLHLKAMRISKIRNNGSWYEASTKTLDFFPSRAPGVNRA